MTKRYEAIAGVVIVNIIVLALGFAIVELGFRLSADKDATSTPTLQWLQFEPFVMFRNAHTHGGGYRWNDAIHNQVISAKIDNNRLGFTMREDVDFARLRPKAENERVVILTGGSAAWGVGATSNETTVAGRMQAILNESQSTYRYTVLNLAMGGWVSVQQFIALAMFGRNLQPDWLVAMDGTNDVAVTCHSSQGAGHPMYYGTMEAYMKAYVFGQLHPVPYRGWLENELIKYSVAYRKLTGRTPVSFEALTDARDPGIGRSIIRPTTWTDVERQLELYIQTESEMVDLLPKAKVILGTQPLPFNFESMFGLARSHRSAAEAALAAADFKDHLDKLSAAAQGRKCGLDLWDSARDWFMPTSASRLEALARRYREIGREVHYVNLGEVFPNLTIDRNAFFIDPVHLNDSGMNVVARRYADMILASDLPDRFTPPRLGGPLPESLSATPQPALDEIRIVEATYGLNCKDFKVPAPAMNGVRLGNASEPVANSCMRVRGSCTYPVDVVRLGDPANSCAKDFSVKWRCGAESDIRQAYLPAEANGKSVAISCAAH